MRRAFHVPPLTCVSSDSATNAMSVSTKMRTADVLPSAGAASRLSGMRAASARGLDRLQPQKNVPSTARNVEAVRLAAALDDGDDSARQEVVSEPTSSGCTTRVGTGHESSLVGQSDVRRVQHRPTEGQGIYPLLQEPKTQAGQLAFLSCCCWTVADGPGSVKVDRTCSFPDTAAFCSVGRCIYDSYPTANPHLKFKLDSVLVLHARWHVKPDPRLEIRMRSPCPSIPYAVYHCRVGLEVGHEDVAFAECW